MFRWIWPSALAVALLAGCESDKVLVLDSTPTGSTARRVVSRGGTSSSSGSSGVLTEHSRGDWARVAPIADRLDPMGKVTRITVHHSGEFNDMDSETEVIAHLRAVQSSQCRSKAAGGLGAGDLAYHFIIDRNGDTWEGRSLSYQGAHAGNSTANRGNIGICVLGNFNVQYPNERQKQSLKELLSRLTERYGLSSSDIYTHREIRAYYGLAGTECPGTHLQSVVDSTRRGSMGRGSAALARDSRR